MEYHLGYETTREDLNEKYPELKAYLDETGYCLCDLNGTGITEGSVIVTKEQSDAFFEIKELRAYLSSTDWCVIKAMEEGTTIDELYPEVHQRRIEARVRINELEGLVEPKPTR